MSLAKTVLIVDDEPFIVGFIAMTLEDDGYRVETASNGRDALQKADAHEPDAVILDLGMPVMDGWTFLKHWRRRPPELRAPVLVISAVCNERRAIESGAQGFLAKPFDLDMLEAVLMRVLDARA